MEADIPSQIAQIRTLSRQELLDLWQKLYRRAAPVGIRRELLVPFLAYKLQENAYGGLKPSTRSELRRIARGFKSAGGSPDRKIRPRVKPGTRILRKWHGETHEVAATDSGYEYCGAVYASLSQIARKITGTQWSGPAFFKLNGTRAREQGHDN